MTSSSPARRGCGSPVTRSATAGKGAGISRPAEAYGLIDDATLRPNPDYWAALLWRRLMGARILRPHVRGAPQRLRIYAACSRTGKGTTLLALNLDRRRSVTLTVADRTPVLRVYRVTAREILDRRILLGGRVLQTGPNGEVPVLHPQSTTGRTIVLAPASYAFVVEPHAGPAACRR
jgi:heparanase 1